MVNQAFISSTGKDLVTYRGAVHRSIDALDHFEPIAMENSAAG